MQHSLGPNVLVQQLLWLLDYASNQSVWQSGWPHHKNQTNHLDLCTLLESPPHILELEEVISVVESSSTSWRSLIACFQWEGILKLEDLILWSPGEVFYRTRSNMALKGVIEVTVHISDPDVRRFIHDFSVGIGLFYSAIKSERHNRCMAVKWLNSVQ